MNFEKILDEILEGEGQATKQPNQATLGPSTKPNTGSHPKSSKEKAKPDKSDRHVKSD